MLSIFRATAVAFAGLALLPPLAPGLGAESASFTIPIVSTIR